MNSDSSKCQPCWPPSQKDVDRARPERVGEAVKLRLAHDGGNEVLERIPVVEPSQDTVFGHQIIGHGADISVLLAPLGVAVGQGRVVELQIGVVRAAAEIGLAGNAIRLVRQRVECLRTHEPRQHAQAGFLELPAAEPCKFSAFTGCKVFYRITFEIDHLLSAHEAAVKLRHGEPP